MDPERLMNSVLRELARGRDVAEILAAAIAAVEPKSSVKRFLRREGRTIVANEKRHTIASGGRVIIVGAGKAGAPMVEAAVDMLGQLVSDGLVIVKQGHLRPRVPRIGRVELVEAGHPVPDERGVAAAARLAALLEDATVDDIVLTLISGGGSALLTLPSEDLTLIDIQATTELLLGCGATIGEINTIRRHSTRHGGGGIARVASPARTISLVISDVVGSPLEAIASGPTAPDPTTFADAWEVVDRYELGSRLPSRMRAHLKRGLRGEIADTTKPSDPIWSLVDNNVIADNRIAAEAAANAARERGFSAEVLTTELVGEAREVGRNAAQIARDLQRRSATEGPLLGILGGETTVKLAGDGLGGRNQELALASVGSMAGLNGALLVTLATDGGDGPTDAAGAVVTGETSTRAASLGLETEDFLRRNDAYNYFAPLDALVKPGPTLTNVNDLLLIAAT
jgi:hydroxypyruvate reductase